MAIRKIKVSEPNGIRKIKISELGTDTSTLNQWESENRDSLERINSYNTKISGGEWLSEDDRASYRQALDSYISSSNKIRDYNKLSGHTYSEDDNKQWNDFIESSNKMYDDVSNYYGQFSDKNKYEQIREYNSVLSAEDFDEYYQKGASVEGFDWGEAVGNRLDILGWKPFGEKKTVENMVTFAESNKNAKVPYSEISDDDGTLMENVELINSHMTEDEKKIYNYYIGKGDKSKADEYLSYVMDDLRKREAGKISEGINNTALEAVFSFGAGAKNFFSGIKNLDNFITGKEGDPTSVMQYAQGMMSSDNKGIWKVTNDLLNTTGNMLPSILVGTVTGGLGGAISMGVSATGNAYSEMRKLGYNEWQSRGYAALVGASEAVLQYAIGGISKLGGKLTGNAVSKFVAKFDNALARTAIKLGGNMASEGLEEAIQTVLEPAFKALVTGEDFESPEWEEVWYSFLLGALSAGALEGAPTIAGNIHSSYKTNVANGGLSNMEAVKAAFKGNLKNAYNTGKQAVTENAGYYVNEALEIDPDNAHAQRMQSRIANGKNVSGYQINRLVEANENALVDQDKAKIKSAVEKRLTELGETGDVGKIADALTKKIAGEDLSLSEKRRIEGSRYAGGIIYEMRPENIKLGKSSAKWAENIGTERINSEAYGRGIAEASEASPLSPEKPFAPENAAMEENATEGKISAPEAIANNDAVNEYESEVAETEESAVTLEEASVKYGAQAQAMVHTYVEGQDVAQYDKAYQTAYDMGKSGVSLSYVMNSKSASYLTKQQRELAYEAGKAAADNSAKEQDAKNKKAATGKTGRRKGAVKGEGVTISDLKKAFNDTQNRAYKILSTYAEATGIDIVLYKSETNADGNFEGAQGKFDWSDDKIYIDINAGLKNIKSVDDLAKYAMVRSFSHEFTHFIEKYNPIWYNEFRKVVFDTLTERGENVNDLIEEKQAVNPGMSYDKASREVVAEAMTDILPDSHFVETLANKHKNIFNKLLEKLKEFLEDVKAYFSTIGHNRSREANALKEQVGETVQYVENIVQMFDKVALEAVENYQMTVAFEEKTEKIDSTNTVNADKDSQKGSKTVKKEVKPNGENVDNRSTVRQSDTDRQGDTQVLEGLQAGDVSGDAQGRDSVGDSVERGQETRRDGDQADNGTGTRSRSSDGDSQSGDIRRVDELTDSDTPIYDVHATLDSVMDKVSAEDIAAGVAKAKNEYKVTDDEDFSIESYVKGRAYDLNRLQRAGDTAEWSELDIYLADSIKSGLLKHPTFSGRTYRNLEFGSVFNAETDYEDFIRENAVGNEVTLNALSSASKNPNGYPVVGDKVIHLVIDGVSARDISETFGLGQEEVIHLPGTKYKVTKVTTANDGHPLIYGEEIVTNEVQELSRGTESTGLLRSNETVSEGHRNDTRRVEINRGSEESISGSGEVEVHESGTVHADQKERLHEEVTEQIAQQSTEKPKGKNFVIGDSLSLPNGEKARYKANVAAIRLVKKLEAEGRYATEFEQTLLSKYVGWGGLANAFDERKADWSAEYKELRELLTNEEYELARGSTLNAHYTDISVIKAMYDGLNKLGFNGGRMMEPSSGVGNFVGAMPAEMSAKVKSWTMVELDGITGLIAKYLYPNADVRIEGFEKANIPNNYMDVIISNVPFGNYPITDKAYPKKVTSAIHNYFFAKSLDKVRPGGIVMFITSSYTMNSKDETVRRYIMQKADLLGAIRLPDNAFKGNAGTEVVTDILVLKKRADNTPYAGEDFLSSPYKYVSGYNGAYINSYFDAHPEMVLGTASMEGGMYRGNNLTYKALEGKGSLSDQIREAFTHIKGKMDYPAQLSREKTNFAVERADKKTKADGYVAKNGKIYQNKDGELVEQSVTPKVAERIKGMLDIRDAAKALMNAQQQGLKETEIKKARANLNKLYDEFVKKNGFLNAPSNKSAFNDDPDRYSVFALENWNPDKKTATKADIFSKNTIAPNRTVTSAKDVSEGLIVSVNQTGSVDVSLIAALTKKSVPEVTSELLESRLAFKNRDGVLETAETYLSGNVRAKLRDAEALVPMDSDYEKNVEALRAVMPEDVSYQDIFVNPGTPWIPSSVYSDFAAYMLGGRNTEYRQDIDVTRNAETGNFTVELKNNYLKFNASNTQKWGTPRRSFLDLFDAMLNSKSIVIKDKLDDGSFVVNKDATAAANEKIENITKEFQEWLWKDEARRTELATLYNEVFNSIVTPKYNGDNLTVNGANAMKPLRPHQRNAVQRIISSGGNTLLAHKVGAGKTYEMAAAAMKLKELGLVKKPMFAVPKSLVAQWGNEFIDFFPTAKLLVAEATDFTTSNRKVFMNRIANGNYDAVIVSYEQFEKLPVSDDFTRELYQDQINSIIAAIEEAKAEKGAKAMSVKDLEKKRKTLQAKIDKLTDKAKDEGNIDFEELGVDSLFIDEAHNFKNLFYTTSMTNVSGLGNKDGSKRAFDLYTKVRYLQKLNGGKGIVFATATPVMNSMSEMYIMQKYLQPDLLEQLGLNTFDAWAKQFGEVVNGVEIKPSGQGYRVKQSFSRFKNMSELQLLFRNFADVLTDIPGLKIPKMKGGAVNVVVCEPGEFQKNFMKELEKRADNIKNVDPSVDNMLKITSDGRKISYTQRMIDPSLPYEDGCKIYRCADNIVKVYNDSEDVKGTQIVFLDMATPKGKSKTETAEEDDSGIDMESARLYDDLKARLVKNGIPEKEIAFIHEADTDAKKKKLFADVNDGKIRVLIGSTGKMGVGMNAQKRIVAIHHLDAPWRPGDVEQRNGRAYRQGNINDEVENFTYVTEGSFDARLWDILERKQNFINQVMNGESVGRETEDTGEVTLSAAEVKALASGSPLILEQVQLDTDIKKLESLYRAHVSSVRAAKERLAKDKGKIELLEKRIELGKSDILSIKDTYSEGKFSLTVGKHKFTEKKDAGVALMTEATAKAVDTGYTTIGSFAGLNVKVIKTPEGIKGIISGKQGYSFNTYPNNTTFMVNHLISVVEGITEKVDMWQTELEEVKKDMAEQEKLINEPFAKQTELDEKRKRYNEVMEILNPKEEQSLDSVAEDTVQEQSREYLDDVQYQQRTDTLTDREVLKRASEIEVIGLNQAEMDALTIFQDRLSKLEDLQEKRAEQGRLYKEQQFGAKPNRPEAKKTLNRMNVLDGQIKKAIADVLTVEEKEVLKRVLKKARKVVEEQERQHGQELLQRWRDRRDNAAAIKKYRDRLAVDSDELSNWILRPDNKDIVKHVPDVLKNSVIPFLSSINFMSKRALKGGDATVSDKKFIKRLDALKSAIKTNIDVYKMYSGYNDLPPDFMESLENFKKSAEELLDKSEGEFIINQMTSDELKKLSKVVRTLKKYIMQMNRFHNNAMYKHVYEAGDNSIDFLKELDNAGSHTGGFSNFLFWQQIRPAYAFERFGEGGVAIYDGLRKGQAKLAFNTKEIEAFARMAYTAAEVRAWENEIKEFKLGKDIVKIPVSHIMSFYELSKDPEAKAHIDGGGIRVATYTRKGKKISDVGHILTAGDVKQIIGSLTDRQREVADNLQKYMAEQGGKWGNYVSVARFGEELFTNKNYFPINSDGRHLSATVEEHPSAAALYALLNMSFTKSRKEGANNRIVLYSIFDVFANHMASMAQYNAMALPILDALKWFNYQQVFIDDEGNKTVVASVREQMSRVYGAPDETKPGSDKRGYAEDFIVNIIKAFNGTAAHGTPYDLYGAKPLRRYNVAQVAYNFRVILQQPLAITRAGMLIDYRSIIKGMKLNPSAIKKNVEEMQKYSGIAAWKSLGFYDVNISRGLTHLIKHDSNALDKITDVGMWGAEKADIWTWAAIWGAAKEEVIKKQHLTPSSEGFYEAVTKLFEDIIYKTQVVDSILTKNEFMRDEGLLARVTASFMSEPVTNASMLIDAVDKYHLDMKRGMSRRDSWRKNGQMIGRRLYVYGVGAVLLAAVQAVADGLRDDDEYEEWDEKWIEAFNGNLVDELMPFNKLPILSDFYDLAKSLLSVIGVDTYGNPPQSVFMQWYDILIKGTEIIYDKIMGENTNYTWYAGIYKLLQAVSGMSGLPLGSATREVITVWNNTVATFAPSLKIVTYEATQTEIRNALYKAVLSGEEKEIDRLKTEFEDEKAVKAALRKALRENDPRIRAAAEAVMNGNGREFSRILNEITAEGKFERVIISGAIAAEVEYLRRKEKEKQEEASE